MGITIHYSGRARGYDAVTAVLTAAQVYAGSRGWQFALYDDPFGIMEDRDKDDPGWVEHEGPYRGIVIHPHRKCEPVRLDFGIDHEMRPAFTKTQFAPFGVHKGVLTLLREIEPHFESLVVVDESGLWESGDETQARDRFELIARATEGRLAEGLRAEGYGVDGAGQAPWAQPLDDTDDGIPGGPRR